MLAESEPQGLGFIRSMALFAKEVLFKELCLREDW